MSQLSRTRKQSLTLAQIEAQIASLEAQRGRLLGPRGTEQALALPQHVRAGILMAEIEQLNRQRSGRIARANRSADSSAAPAPGPPAVTDVPAPRARRAIRATRPPVSTIGRGGSGRQRDSFTAKE